MVSLWLTQTPCQHVLQIEGDSWLPRKRKKFSGYLTWHDWRAKDKLQWSQEKWLMYLYTMICEYFFRFGEWRWIQLKPFKSTFGKKRYCKGAHRKGLVGKKKANCLQASLPSVNIVPQEQIVFLAKAQDMWKNEKEELRSSQHTINYLQSPYRVHIESNKSNIESIKRLWRISSSIKDSKQVMKPDRICLPIRPAKRIFDQNWAAMLQRIAKVSAGHGYPHKGSKETQWHRRC